MIRVVFIIMYLNENRFEIKNMDTKEFINFMNSKNGGKVDVAFDQSTSCTGFTIEYLDEGIIYVGEIVNHNLYSEYYVRALLNVVSLILENKDVRYAIIEEPLKYITGNQNHVLVDLKNRMIDLLESDKLTIEKFHQIQPQSWRSGLIGKDNPHKKNSKMATVYEVEKLYPMMKNFEKVTHNPSNNSGFDGFESLGILLGFRNRFKVSRDSEIVMNLGPKNTRKVALTMFAYCTSDSDELKELVSLAQLMISKPKQMPKFKYYNKECGVYLNAKMSLTDDLTLLVVDNAMDVVSTLIQFKLEYDPEKVLYMITVPLSMVNKKLPDALRLKGYKINIYY